jgi:hypothetical protein
MRDDTRSRVAKPRSPENKAHFVSPEVKRKRSKPAAKRKVGAK